MFSLVLICKSDVSSYRKYIASLTSRLDVKICVLTSLKTIQQQFISWDFMAMREELVLTDQEDSFNIICGERHFIIVFPLHIE